MAHPKRVRAAKDYPDAGIKKGDEHYVWATFRGPTRRSLTPPTRSQLTTSDFKSQLYGLVDETLPGCKDAGELRDLAGEVRTLGEEEGDKLQNLPESLQNSPAGEKFTTRQEELEAWADEIEAAADELGDESDFSKDHSSGEDTYTEAVAAVISELESSSPDPE